MDINDAELRAISQILKELNCLGDIEYRKRVLSYLSARVCADEDRKQTVLYRKMASALDGSQKQ